MYYVYVLSSQARKYIYVGLANNAGKRIHQHNAKKEKTTRAYAPFYTLLVESFPSRIVARKREKYLKSGAGKELLKTLQL